MGEQSFDEGPSGKEVTTEIRKNTSSGSPFIIGISGSYSESDRQLSLDSGQDMLLPKPIPRHINLAKLVASLLTSRGSSVYL
eukprot:NODE_11275_length_310_cov_21.750958_g10362_i0.p3 GENE.NODE_11275_length_310_cov_21.750958_g10362_i0~~NODE_11275_length_310_cov_21.750958_g10362_i0.p3  ORF type:complete len:92 (+),score=20.76 NODE_11275_length_310_cov_21.750958_g10362_i0:33-278(+)